MAQFYCAAAQNEIHELFKYFDNTSLMAQSSHDHIFLYEGHAADNPPQQDKLSDPPDCEQPYFTETPSLRPQRFKITIFNRQIPSRIMATSTQAICHPVCEKLEEKLSLLLVVCDADSARMQAVPLQVDLYKAGMKRRNFTCYLSVNGSTNLQGTTASRKQVKHPIFHVQRNASLEPGQIGLQFSFSRPDTLYTITFRLHSIIDSEGIEVIGYTSESAEFTICTANCLQDVAPVRGSGLPLLEISGPLKSPKCNQIVKAINREGLSGNIGGVEHLTRKVQKSHISLDIKALTLIYTGCFVSFYKSSAMLHSKELFDKALELSKHSDCQNSKLLERMALTFMAQSLRMENRLEDAQSLLDRAKIANFGAAPSGVTSSMYYQQAVICAGQCKGPITADVKQRVDQLLTLMIEHGKRCEGYDAFP